MILTLGGPGGPCSNRVDMPGLLGASLAPAKARWRVFGLEGGGSLWCILAVMWMPLL